MPHAPARHSRASTIAFAAAAGMGALAVAALLFATGGEEPPRRAATPAVTTTSRPADPPPATDPRRGSGMFGTPLAPGEPPAPRAERIEEPEENLPTSTAQEPRRSRRRRHAERAEGEARSRDRYAVFESDVATPYASSTQATIDDLPLDGTAGTISFWMQPAWAEDSHDDAALVTFGDGMVRLLKNVTFLRFEVLDGAGNLAGLGAPIAEWRAGEWHQIVATWDGRVIWLYVDGALVSTGAQLGPIPLPPGTPVHIGSAFPLGRPVAPAALAGVSVRTRALTPNAVAKRFLTGPRPGG